MFPYLAVFDDKAHPETVKYHLLPTFLLAGYQEQQRIIAAQGSSFRGSRPASTRRRSGWRRWNGA